MKIAAKVNNVVRHYYYRTFRNIPDIVNKVKKESLTYLDEPALTDLYDVITHIKNKNIPGIIMEAGCALGGSAIVIGTALAGSRDLYVYDTFGMIPEPTEKDGDDVVQRYDVIKSGASKGLNGNKYYGYETDLLNKVKQSFKDHRVTEKVHFVQGLFEETMQVHEPVAFCHVDGDWYSSVYTCLEQVVPHLSKGGILVIDDYYRWSGAKTAVNDFFADKRDQFEFVKKSRLHVVKK